MDIHDVILSAYVMGLLDSFVTVFILYTYVLICLICIQIDFSLSRQPSASVHFYV